MYKLYLNFEGCSNLPEYTFIHKACPNSDVTIQQLLATFCAVYNDKRKQALSADRLLLLSSNGKLADPTCHVISKFRNGSDVTVQLRAANDTSSSHSALPSTSACGISDKPPEGLHFESATVQAEENRIEENDTECEAEILAATTAVQQLRFPGQANVQKCSPLVKQLLERASEAESKKYFCAACKIYEQVRLYCGISSIND